MKRERHFYRKTLRSEKIVRTRRLFLENLEHRTLLAADVDLLSDLAFPLTLEESQSEEVQARLQMASSFGGAQFISETAESQQEQRAAAIAKSVPAEYRSPRVNDLLTQTAFEFDQFRANPAGKDFVPSISTVKMKDQFVLVQAVTTGSGAELAKQLEAIGAKIDATSGPAVAAWVPAERLRDLAAVSNLEYASAPVGKPRTFIGDTTTQGDVAQLSVDVRNRLGLDGTGVRIGVISDSYNNLGGAVGNVTSGDLPGATNPFGNMTPVDVVGLDYPGSDEGRAMLQLIHDIAPKAELVFITGFGPTKVTLAAAIDTLISGNSVDIIVDDVIYPDEPVYMDGLVAQAAERAISAGIPYISAAGNYANKAYEATSFVYSGYAATLSGIGTRYLHDFDSSAGIDAYQQLTIPPLQEVDVILQWQDPFKVDAPSSTGATRNFDLIVFDNSSPYFPNVLTSSASNNIGNNPVEGVTITNPSSTTNRIVNIGIGRSNLTDSTRLKLIYMHPYVTVQYGGSPTLFGHMNAQNVLTVGAASYLQTPAYGVSPAVLQDFSALGGGSVYFNDSGTAISAQVRNTPDVVGPDNGNTTFFGQSDVVHATDPDTYLNFRGTSASAPHVAALVALMMQANPALTPAQLFAAVTGTAGNMGPAGFDNWTGHGFVNGLEAAFASLSPAAPDLIPASDDGVFSIDNVTSQTSLTFTGTVPAASYVGIFANGSATPSSVIQLGAGVTSYSLAATAVGDSINTFTVKVKNLSTSPVWSQASPALTVYVDSVLETLPFAPDLSPFSDSGVDAGDNFTTDTNPLFSGTVPSNLSGAYLQLIVDGVVVSTHQVPVGLTYYNFNQTLAYGAHEVRFRAYKLGSAPASAYYLSDPAYMYIDDGQAPTATITPIANSNLAASSFTITFDRPVANFNLADLVFSKNGGANRFPLAMAPVFDVTYNEHYSRSFAVSHITDITMGAAAYSLTLNYSGSGIVSAASGVAPTQSNRVINWTQGSNTYQNSLRYLDVNADGMISAFDAITVINHLNMNYQPPGYLPPVNYIDTNGDNLLSAFDALLVLNFLNEYTPAPLYPPL